MDEEKRLPQEWERRHGVLVADPDGWRTEGIPWMTPITSVTFIRLAGMSTVEETQWVEGAPEPARSWT